MIQVGDLLNKRYRVLKELKPGGFARIFEVRDIRQRNLKNGFGLLRERSIKILKVLNQFGNRQQDAEFLFRREISLLKQLDHPAVVRYADDFDLIQDQRIIPCLVMEKVPGVTIEEWLQENGAVSEEIALDWLLQFAEVLDYLHNEQRVMHLDIKPANVMVTPRGELVLIDFGIARPISSTLLAKLIDSGESIQHRAATDWFSAPEQLQGRPIAQSDFYSVGRTMICAVTNLSPGKIIEDDEGTLLWMEKLTEVSAAFKKLIQCLSAFSVTYRLSDHQLFKEESGRICEEKFSTTKSILYKLEGFGVSTAFPSIAIASCIMMLRFFGALQPFELMAYDLMLRLRPDKAGSDPRITIIEVSHEDVREQIKRGIDGQGSLSDEALRQLLAIIQPYKPAVIGVDIFRQNYISEFAEENIILGCAITPNTPDFHDPISDEFDLERASFFDLIGDPLTDGVRRQFLVVKGKEHCNPTYSFSYRLAKEYLLREGINILETEPPYIWLGSKPVVRINQHEAFYSSIDDSGYQTLVNYRTYDAAAISIRLFDILDGEVNPGRLSSLISNKVVIIGTTDKGYVDYHPTPYGVKPGVVIQAHMVSNLLDIATNKSKSLWYVSRKIENGLILLISLSIISTIRFASLHRKLLILFLTLLIVFMISLRAIYIYFLILPVIPLSLSLVFSVIFTLINKNRSIYVHRISLLKLLARPKFKSYRHE